MNDFAESNGMFRMTNAIPEICSWASSLLQCPPNMYNS